MIALVIRPFFITGIAWLALIELAEVQQGVGSGALLGQNWGLRFWLLAIVDLVALGKVIATVFEIMAGDLEKKRSRILRAFYWGTIKLACLGIFSAVLILGRGIPALSLVMGIGTLVVVPMATGVWWNQRVSQDA